MIYDVVIVGGGPVGLFLASELRLAEVSVAVVEQAEDLRSPLKRLPFGLRGLSAATTEAFHRRGLLSEIIAAQQSAGSAGINRTAAAAHWLQQARRPAGHFAGIQFYEDQLDSTKWPFHLASPAGSGLPVEMELLERVLAARAAAMGVEIFRGCRADEFSQSGDGVRIHAGGESFQARWLVGCDGGRSVVRKQAGFEFAGTEPEFTGYSIELELADPGCLAVGRHYTANGMYTYTRPGTIALVDFDGGAMHRAGAILLEHVQEVLRRVSGIDVEVKNVCLATTWTDRAFQATRYRHGRVLLAGDAAHIHSPLGGQGLNLGLGDAMNLGWKLAATIRGDAPAGLLDTFAAERHPVGAAVLEWSRAQVALMRPTRSSRALADIMRDLLSTPDGATYFAKRIRGIATRYDLGGEHALVGRSVPDFELLDGVRVGDLLRDGKGLLLNFGDPAPLQSTGQRWARRLNYVCCDAKERFGLSAVLVRPDGIVAWISEGAADVDAADRAAARWFGSDG